MEEITVIIARLLHIHDSIIQRQTKTNKSEIREKNQLQPRKNRLKEAFFDNFDRKSSN